MRNHYLEALKYYFITLGLEHAVERVLAGLLQLGRGADETRISSATPLDVSEILVLVSVLQGNVTQLYLLASLLH